MPGTPARAAHGSSHTEQMVADDQRDRIARLRVGRQPSPPSPKPEVASPEKSAAVSARTSPPIGALPTDFIGSDSSTELSRRRIAAVLSVPCPTCATSKGTYCFEGAHGFCIDRWSKGMRMVQSTVRPGDLEKLAAAQRAVNRRHEREAAEAAEAARRARGGRR